MFFFFTADFQCDIALANTAPFSSPSSVTSSNADVKPVQTLVRRERQTVITDAREAMAAAAGNKVCEKNNELRLICTFYTNI